MTLMKDIVDVPVIETVVRLDDASQVNRRGQIVKEFVLTRQVERNLSAVAVSVKEHRGRGFFLIGPYGSGKSHFLSYVSLVLSGEVRANGNCPLVNAVGAGRFMPLRISLVNVRNDRRLEEAVLESAERQIRAGGISVNLTKRSRFLNYIDEIVRAVHAGDLDAYLVSCGLPVWDELKKGDPDKAVVVAWKYIKSVPELTDLPDASPDVLLLEIVKNAGRLGYEGVLIVIDELSEFLRSKPSQVALNEDARYLQLLGEVSRSENILIIASLQEAIEQTGDISRHVIAKIKDRYPVKLSLDEQHIKDLIDGRLVVKKEGSRERIREIWLKYTECLPHFDTPFEDFYRLYPIHPATVRYLEGLKNFFSAHRGVVDFIVTQIRGGVKGENAGLLCGPASKLVTVDMIYGHFRDRIREDTRFVDYDTLVRRDLHRVIDNVFTESADRELATRVCDVLILNKIAELERPKNISELVVILMLTISSVSPKANEEYLSDVILERLLKESPFLSVVKGKNLGERVFEVSLVRNETGLLQMEMERVLSSISPGDARIPRLVFGNVRAEMPVYEVVNGAMRELIITWRGTQRRGVILWAESFSMAEIDERFAEFDFVVSLCPPGFKFLSGEKLPANALAWIPIFSDDEQEKLRRFYVAKLLSGDDSVERIVRELAVEVVKGAEGAVAGVIDSGFKKGIFISVDEESKCASNVSNAANLMERFLTTPAINILTRLHPKFLEVAPNADFVSRRTVAPLIDSIIIPGRISMAVARKNNTRTMIEGVLVAMGLACAQGPSFVMQVDPSRSQLVRFVMGLVGENNDLAELLCLLRRGPYGLTDELVEILIVSMVHAGLVDIKKGGRKIPTGIVGLSHVREADEIHAGELLSLEVKQGILADPFLSRGMDATTFSISSQREVWERLLSAKDRLEERSQNILSGIASISKYPAFDGLDFGKIRKLVEQGIEVANGIEVSMGAVRGLARYLSMERPPLGSMLETAEAVNNFVTDHSERLIRVADYLRNIPPEIKLSEEAGQELEHLRELLANLTNIVLQDKAGEILESFDKFLDLYSAWYVEQHLSAYAKELFEPAGKLRNTEVWRALVLASGISGIHLVDDANAIGRRIDTVLARFCKKSPSIDLRLRPKCACGFIPGIQIEVEDASHIERSIDSGLEEAINILSSAPMLERLVARISVLRDTDPQRSKMLEDIFCRLRDKMSRKDFLSFMTPSVAGLLNDVLKREVVIIKKRVEDLSGKLAGRRLPPPRVREIFDEWLGNEERSDVVIDLGDGKDFPVSNEALLVGWTKDHGLDDEKARLAFVVSRDVSTAPDSAQLTVNDVQLGKMIELTGLSGAGGDEVLRILSSEQRCQAFAWRCADQLAQHLLDGWSPHEDIACNYDDVGTWCNAVLSVTRPFFSGEISDLIRQESRREYAMSFLKEHYFQNNFPSLQTIERLQNNMAVKMRQRDQAFSLLPPWQTRFDDLIGLYPNAIFLFLDAARWDIIVRLDEFVKRAVAGIKKTDERWCLVAGSSTMDWQELVFGTADLDAIKSIFKARDVRYIADAERVEVRNRVKEEADDSRLWLRVGIVDRLVHSSLLPLNRLIDSAVAEIGDVILDLAGLIKDGRRLVILTDHGFTELQEKGGRRYGHESATPSNMLAGMIVYERN